MVTIKLPPRKAEWHPLETSRLGSVLDPPLNNFHIDLLPFHQSSFVVHSQRHWLRWAIHQGHRLKFGPSWRMDSIFQLLWEMRLWIDARCYWRAREGTRKEALHAFWGFCQTEGSFLFLIQNWVATLNWGNLKLRFLLIIHPNADKRKDCINHVHSWKEEIKLPCKMKMKKKKSSLMRTLVGLELCTALGKWASPMEPPSKACLTQKCQQVGHFTKLHQVCETCLQSGRDLLGYKHSSCGREYIAREEVGVGWWRAWLPCPSAG